MNTLIKAILFGGGVYLLYRTGILSSITGGVVPAPAAGAAPPAGGGTAPAAGPPAFNSLVSTLNRTAAAAIQDYQGGDRSNQLTVTGGVPSTTWNAWNYFLQKQTNFSDLPTYQQVTGQPDTGQPMTIMQYEQLIGPWLTANHGMSGLGWYGYNGMGWHGGAARQLGMRTGLAGWINSFPDRKTPRNLFYPNVRVWGF